MNLGLSYVPGFLPHHIEADLKEMKAIGCNEVLFAIQENHLDTLTGAVEFGARIARDCGIQPLVVVWGYANTFGGGCMSNLLLGDREMWRLDKDGNPAPKGCLNNPKLADRFIDIIARCRRNGFEGVMIDEPTPQECFCPHCREGFGSAFGGDIKTASGSTDYRRFCLDSVSRYVDRICKGVKAIDPRLKTITVMMPHDHAAFERVAAIPEMDVFGTDPYWLVPGAAEFIGVRTVREAVDCARTFKTTCQKAGKQSQMWLNSWKIPAGKEKEIYEGGRQLAAVGYDSFYAWSFRAAQGTNESCENPDEAWKQLSKLYRELSA